jgi:hypothetical protein
MVFICSIIFVVDTCSAGSPSCGLRTHRTAARRSKNVARTRDGVEVWEGARSHVRVCALCVHACLCPRSRVQLKRLVGALAAGPFAITRNDSGPWDWEHMLAVRTLRARYCTRI